MTSLLCVVYKNLLPTTYSGNKTLKKCLDILIKMKLRFKTRVNII